jgi:nucleoside-diphosphate-sugar epimerase
MRIVVTGAGGFIGWHVTDALGRRGDSVQAWTRHGRESDWDVPILVAPVDITDPAAVANNLNFFKPDLIIHLAGQSFPGLSWQQPALTYAVNVIGAVHLLEGSRALVKPARVVIVGSSAEYAESAGGAPIGEDAPTVPNSPYGTSKLAADQLAQLYVRRYQLDLVRVRPFFLTGPRKTGDISSDFGRRVVSIERGEERLMRVGSLDVIRDIIDIRDGVSGLLLIAEAGRAGEVYNLCGGRRVAVRDILETYRRLARVELEIVADPALTRPLEQSIKVGDPRKLQALGWSAKYELDDTLGSILDYWRGASPTRA